MRGQTHTGRFFPDKSILGSMFPRFADTICSLTSAHIKIETLEVAVMLPR